MSWPVVLLVATNQASLSLRRYASSKPCADSGYGIHNAHALIGTAPIVVSESGTWDVESVAQPPHNDPRWPRQCVCGSVFEDADEWQLFKDRLYRRADTGALLTLAEAEPGMIWDAHWYLDCGWVGSDGRSLVMRLPGAGEWAIDAISQSGGRWTRTGEPPHITVRPSILSYPSKLRQGYHGWVTEGVLSDDLDGRTY